MKKKIIIILFLSLGRLTETIAQTPSAGKNSIMEKMPREAMTTVAGATHTTVQTAIQYFDGLGRPTQTILYKASPDATKDIVASYTEYDGFGNPYKNILPTPSDVATGAYNTTVQTLAESFYNDTHPYQQSVLEQSPLNRVIETFGAGQAWRVLGSEKSTKIAYGAAGNEILEFRINTTGSVDVLGAYGGSSLYVQSITSERGFRTNEYKDRLGRVVAKSQELTKDVFAVTGFIYDDLNRLRIVVQPEAYKTVSTLPSFTLGSTVCQEGMFYYLYDSRGRVAQKQVPGGGIIRYIYDRNDRVVLENDDRDANIQLPDRNYYKFSKYDIFGRIIQTGLIFGIGGFSPSQIQKDFDDFADVSTNIIYEERGTDLRGYTNRSFPSSYTPIESSLRTVTYYDDYANWQTDVDYNFKPTQAFHTQANTKGMVTGTLVRNLETNAWYKFVNFYDYLGRIIQQFSQNNVGGIDRNDYQYRFNGEVLKMRMTHQKTGVADLVELYQYSYDHAGRKTSFTHDATVVARYQYDEIGRLSSKRNRPSGTTLSSSQTGNWNTATTWQSSILPLANDNVTINSGQTVTIPNGDIASAGILNDRGTLLNFGTLNMGKSPTADLFVQNFSYHIRGGLRGQNLDASGNVTNSLFSLKLGYEDANFFDGNIGKQEWKSNIDNITRSYTYSYDGSSRITGGLYAGTGAENYSLNSVTYDANGNIKTLSRNGWKSNNSFGVVDNLNYTYLTNSNKILKVDDLENETASFSDVTGNDYTYLQDGSLASDANKGITIEYNYLKLPRRIIKGSTVILNEYDATGKKLKETIGTNYTDYSGNKIYKNGALYQISHDEGRIIDGQYEYFINDHLGNLRVAFRDSSGVAKISQKQDFDPWGAELQKLSYLKNSWKQSDFKYSGKEFIEQTGLNDFGWRQQDAILGRMWGIDFRAEKYYGQSPMQFAMNNPISFVEVDGDTVRYTGMSDETSNTLQNQINSYANASPFFKQMMGYLQSSTNIINVTIGQTNGGVSGHFIPNQATGGTGGTVTFLTGITINAQTVIEEFAHAVQLEMKPSIYPNIASSNVEYEAKIAVGIVGQDLEQKNLEMMSPALNLGGMENSLKVALMNGGTPYNNSKGMLDFSSSNMATSQFQSFYTRGVTSFVEHWSAQGLPFGSTYVRKPSNHQPLMIQSIQKAIGK